MATTKTKTQYIAIVKFDDYIHTYTGDSAEDVYSEAKDFEDGDSSYSNFRDYVTILEVTYTPVKTKAVDKTIKIDKKITI